MPTLDSSVLREVEYADRDLAVTFVGGRRYRYRNVPRRLYDELLASSSKGTFFNQKIRDRFAVVEMTGP